MLFADSRRLTEAVGYTGKTYDDVGEMFAEQVCTKLMHFCAYRLYRLIINNNNNNNNNNNVIIIIIIIIIINNKNNNNVFIQSLKYIHCTVTNVTMN